MDIIEIYILCESRSKDFAVSFLEKFIPSRTPCADEYFYPEYDETAEQIYKDVGQLFSILESNVLESYSLYWDAIDIPKVKNGMLFYTEDGYMLAGLAVEQDSVEKLEQMDTHVVNVLRFTGFENKWTPML